MTLIYAGGVRDGADMAKALALGADAIAIGTGSMIALNCNKDIPVSYTHLTLPTILRV